MIVVAGLSLKNLCPRVWDPASEYFLPNLRAIMVSYADFHKMPARRTAAMNAGLRKYLGVPPGIKVYLDNGSFFFMGKDGGMPYGEYEEFVQSAKPDWYPIPQDFIPTPKMNLVRQRECLEKTMRVNIDYKMNGYVPVIHVSQVLDDYVQQVRADPSLRAKRRLALGGIVPNLLRTPKAAPYADIFKALTDVRRSFAKKEIHVFGIGGTATLHIASLLGIDSVDSSGWRNRAARGLVQLPGSGDRMVTKLGSWRGRAASNDELAMLENCLCPACRAHGMAGLTSTGIHGFRNRATHNLWVLLNEAEWLEARKVAGSYRQCYRRRLVNSIYLPLIQVLVEETQGRQPKASRAASR